MSFFQRQPPQLASSPFSSGIFGNISLLSQQQQEASRAFLGDSKAMDSDMRLQSMDETLSDQEQDESQSDKVSGALDVIMRLRGRRGLCCFMG